MTWWAWLVVGLACWVLVIAAGLIAWIATIEWHRRHRDPKRPAGGEPPASPRTGARSPLPGPRHNHRGCDMVIRLYRCGCIHFHDRTGAITEAWPCHRPAALDWDQFLKDLTS